MTNISQIAHVSFLVSNTQRAVEFYQTILGLPIDLQRPDLGFPGAWFKVGQQQIHLLELPNPDPIEGRPDHGGRDRHVALMVKSLAQLEKALNNADITFTRSRSGRRALFCRDPDGNALEFIEE